MAVVKKFTFNAIAENTYIVFDETKQCVIIDPGCNNDAERKILQSFIEQEEEEIHEKLSWVYQREI